MEKKDSFGITPALNNLAVLEELKDLNDFSKMYKWRLSEYVERTPIEKAKEKWDELEKSIIMNFADDISISIRDDIIEMVIIKNI